MYRHYSGSVFNYSRVESSSTYYRFAIKVTATQDGSVAGMRVKQRVLYMYEGLVI